MSQELSIILHGKEVPDRQRNVTINFDNHETTAVLKDPFDHVQHQEYAWYLESYLQHEPFAGARANGVIRSIQKYGQTLLECLHLRSLVVNKIQLNGERRFLLIITINEAYALGSGQYGIYWEILEDSGIWKLPGLQVSVRRLYSSLDHRQIAKDQSNPPAAGLPRTINVLVLSARDLSEVRGNKDEPDPNLALRVLLRIEESLKKRGKSIQLRIEVVRPGSLQALHQHLQSARTNHGAAYYHIVHLDVHGVILPDGTPKLHLSSADQSTLKTQRESPEDLAALFHANGIKNVVVNACRSASMIHGIKVNVAQVFMQLGIENVVAMSFKITPDAASIFLMSFYYALLVDRHDFTLASHSGRQALLTHGIREARLCKKAQLIDYGIPVLYSSTTSPGQRTPDEFLGLSAELSELLQSMDKSLSEFEGGLASHKLVGRDLDMLKLEKEILASPQLYISGRAGVGKTALLRHATEIWKRTHFVEVVVFMDFSARPLTTFREFLVAIARHLPIRQTEWNHIQANDDPEEIAQAIWDIIVAYDTIVVFDGLHNLYSRAPKVLQSLPMRDREQVELFLGNLFSLARSADRATRVFMLLVSRWSSKPNPLQVSGSEALDWRFTGNHFRVHSLRSSESMKLAQKIWEKLSPSHSTCTSSDLQELELMQGCLDGNPAAILFAMQIKSSAESWSTFREKLHRGSALKEHNLRNPDSSICLEIFHLFAQSSFDANVLLFALGLFWNEVPGASLLLSFLTEQKFVLNPLQASTGLLLVQDRGFVDPRDVDSYWVHPVFTLVSRLMGQLVLTGQLTPKPSHTLPGWQRQMFLAEHERMKRLASMQVSVLCLDSNPPEQNYDNEERVANMASFRNNVLYIIASHSTSRLASLSVKGYNYADAYANWNAEQSNLDTCLTICLEVNTLTALEWPIEYLLSQASLLGLNASPRQLRHFTERFDQLFKLLLTKNGTKSFEWGLQKFSILLPLALTAIYSNELYNMVKYDELSGLTIEIIHASEKEFGPYQDPTMQYVKTMAYRYRGSYYEDNNEPLKADEWFQEMNKLESELFQNPVAMNQNLSEDHLRMLTKKIADSGDDEVATGGRIKNLTSGAFHFQFHRSRRNLNKTLKGENIAEIPTEPNLESRLVRSFCAKLTSSMTKLLAILESMGIYELQQDERWPEDMHQKILESKNPANAIQALEDAVNYGDIEKVKLLKEGLLLEAFSKIDLDAVYHHLNRLQKIFGEIESLSTAITHLRDLIDLLEDTDFRQYTVAWLVTLLHHINCLRMSVTEYSETGSFNDQQVLAPS